MQQLITVSTRNSENKFVLAYYSITKAPASIAQLGWYTRLQTWNFLVSRAVLS